VRGPHCWYSIGGRVIGRFSSISMGKKKKVQQQNMYSIGGRVIGRFSSISMGKKRKYSSKIYRPRQPADAGPGGLKK